MRRAVESDVCIVGSGISAAMVADRLARTTTASIVVVEAGDETVPLGQRLAARERFLASFDPARCRFVEVDHSRAGFYTLRPRADHWLLDHLYIVPAHQGKGIGAAVLREILAEADEHRMPVHVGALRGSDSNRFYERHGFVRTGEAEWDIYYRREPGTATT